MFSNRLPAHDPARSHLPLMSRHISSDTDNPTSTRYPAHSSHDIPPVPPQYHLHPSQTTPYHPPQISPSQNPAKRKHVCPTCDRGFTTSGHLARHTRVHTGERNHKCPFPGCETRCSRQDNLQQHYRIHLSPGSRRSSASATRAAMTRAMGASDPARSAKRDLPVRGKSASLSVSAPTPPDSPPLEPPPLAPAYARPHTLTEPPNTPPPLGQPQAPLPVLIPSAYPSSSNSVSGRSSANSPEVHFPSSQNSISPGPTHTQHWDYRQSSAAYDADAQASFSQNTDGAYRNADSPPSPAASADSQYHGHSQVHHPPHHQGIADETYPYPAQYELQYPQGASVSHHSIPQNTAHMQTQYTQHSHVVSHVQAHHNSAPGSTSRHSIAHISHPYSNPSPVSSDSQSPVASHPPTPVYSSSTSASVSMSQFHTDYATSQPSHGYSHSYPGQSYHTTPGLGSAGRYHSPPPILAPIHNERVVRGEPEPAVRHANHHATAAHSTHHGHSPAHHFETHQHHQHRPEVEARDHYAHLHQPQPQHAAAGHVDAPEGYLPPYYPAEYYSGAGWRAERDELVQ